MFFVQDAAKILRVIKIGNYQAVVSILLLSAKLQPLPSQPRLS